METPKSDRGIGGPCLYLMPSTMSDGAVDCVIPAVNIRIASEIRYFIVENVRTARRFLRRCDSKAPIDEMTFFVLNRHTTPAEIASMLDPMADGHDMAVISEAGCPAIADPGADVVAIAQRKGYRVEPLVGPSSILMSLMGSGFNGQSFAFNGYLPIDNGERTARLKELERRIRQERQTQIFIETPYRNNRLIGELVKSLPGNMLLCVASDITGPGQSIITRSLSWWATAKYNYDKIPTIFLLYS